MEVAALEFLIQNLPVAVALIIMTQLFLKYLKGKDAVTGETIKDLNETLRRNTEVIAELKILIEGMERILMTLSCAEAKNEKADC